MQNRVEQALLPANRIDAGGKAGKSARSTQIHSASSLGIKSGEPKLPKVKRQRLCFT